MSYKRKTRKAKIHTENAVRNNRWESENNLSKWRNLKIRVKCTKIRNIILENYEYREREIHREGKRKDVSIFSFSPPFLAILCQYIFVVYILLSYGFLKHAIV